MLGPATNGLESQGIDSITDERFDEDMTVDDIQTHSFEDDWDYNFEFETEVGRASEENTFSLESDGRAGEENTLSLAVGEENTLSLAVGEENTLSLEAGEENTLSLEAGEENNLSLEAGEENTLSLEAGEVELSGVEGGVSDGGDEDEEFGEVDTEEVVGEAMQRISNVSEVPIELRPCDISENQLVEEFMSNGCSCTKWSGKPCSRQFTVTYIKGKRLEFRELENRDLDMFIKGQLSATSTVETSTTSANRKVPRERKNNYTAHYHQGKVICQKMFLFIHSIGSKRLKNISKSLRNDGVGPRTHGNTKRLPKWTLTLNDVEYLIRFLLNYTEQHGLLLPGRVPGYSRDDIKLLPSSVSKRMIWDVYFEAAEQTPDVHAVSYSKFRELWRKLLPSIILMKPMTDLCWTCHKNSTAILRTANCPNREKSDVLKGAYEHLRIVQCERSYYKTTCDSCKKKIQTYFTTDGEFQSPTPAPANSRDLTVHYSFDYAQQVHYPSDPLQPGPVYFLTARKCSVFGVNCEAIPRQVNFLNDEAGFCGKGANTVVSQLHYFFENHGLGEMEVFLHADNCTGQNKNNAMIHYLLWRVQTGKHTRITLSFLVVGHTKFSPDLCFGLFKRLYRRTKVGSLMTTAQVVNTSAECNTAQLVTKTDGILLSFPLTTGQTFSHLT